MNNVEEIYNMKGLRELYLNGFSHLDIDKIDTYLLTHLHLDYCNISTLYLIGCSYLKELSLSNNRISKLEGIAFRSSLSKLIVRNNYIKDLTPLSLLYKLAELDLYGNDIKNFSPLYGLKKLRTLTVTSISWWQEKQLKKKLPQLTIKQHPDYP